MRISFPCKHVKQAFFGFLSNKFFHVDRNWIVLSSREVMVGHVLFREDMSFVGYNSKQVLLGKLLTEALNAIFHYVSVTPNRLEYFLSNILPSSTSSPEALSLVVF